MDELFSSADGTLQFIELNGVTAKELAGLPLTAWQGGSRRTFTLSGSARSTRSPRTPYLLIVSQSLARLEFGPFGVVGDWDYVMPDGFLPVSGGTVTIGGIDQWRYERIPVDGYSALYRSGVGVHNAHSAAHELAVVLDIGNARWATDYVSDSYNRHFFATCEDEIERLDSGSISGWHPLFWDHAPSYTGFGGYARPVEVLSHPVCRFYIPEDDAHFFTASEAECSDVQARFPHFVLESANAFYAGLPDPVTRACAAGTGPLYGLWHPATGDHWYTADAAARTSALAQGYVPEGADADGVAMCVLRTCWGTC